jgi:hypothetical protein
MKGGRIPPDTIVDVGVVGAPDPDTSEVPSIMAHQRGRLSVKSDLEARIVKQLDHGVQLMED